MTRYIEVTHKYIIPVPAEEMDTIEPVADEGVAIMERQMQKWAKNLFEVRSDWQLLPREYVPPHGEITFDLTKEGLLQTRAGRADVTHPWDQGLRVLPLEHPLAGAELKAMEQEGVRCDFTDNPSLHQCVLVQGHPGEHVLEIAPGVLTIE